MILKLYSLVGSRQFTGHSIRAAPMNKIADYASIVSLILFCVTLLLLRSTLNAHPGHMDEFDYLFVGKTLLGGGDWPSHSYIFGSDFNWYLYAFADEVLGGLSGARALASVLGLISLVGLFVLNRLLWRSTAIALFSALLVSIDAAHIFISQLATYDIVALCLFVWSLVLLVKSCTSDDKYYIWTIAAAIGLSLAVLSKYTVILYLPFIALICLWVAPRKAMIGTLIITLLLGSYLYQHWEQLHTLYEIQISSAHGPNASRTNITARIVNQLWPITVLIFIFVICIPNSSKREITLGLLCIGLSFPLIAYHYFGQNVISLQKHLVFSSIFLSGIAAWSVKRLFDTLSLSKWYTPAAFCLTLAVAAHSIKTLSIMKSTYPDITQALAFTDDIAESGSLLSEDPYMMRYALFGDLEQSSISETTWLDNNKDGKHEKRDVKEAIWDRKFAYIFLTDQRHANDNKTYRKMLTYRNYHRVLHEPYTLTLMSGSVFNGELSLYKRMEDSINLSTSD